MQLKTLKLRRIKILAGSLLIFVGITWLIGWSSIFTVKTITVTGLTKEAGISSEQLIKNSGVRLGDQMARINARSIARKLEIYPNIAEVNLKRDWPNHLIIKLNLKVPIAASKSGNQYLLYDSNGVAFASSQRLPKDTLLILGNSSKGITGAVKIFRNLPTQLSESVTAIAAGSPERIIFTFSTADQGRKIRVIWGSSLELEKKIQVASLLLQRGSVRLIDVSAPMAPTTR